MNDADQITKVIFEYCDAAKCADMNALARICTPAMLRQFSACNRFAIRLASVLMPKRFKNLLPQRIEVEKQDETKAIVSYVVAFGRRRQYERVVLVKQNDQWLVDEKYA